MSNNAKTIQNDDKRNKAEPKEVGLIDVLIEIRELRGELKQLRREFEDHRSSDRNRRIG